MDSESRAQRHTPKKSREERIAAMDKDILDTVASCRAPGLCPDGDRVSSA